MRDTYLETSKALSSTAGLGDIVIPGIFLALLLRFDKRVTETAALRDGTVRKVRVL